MGIRKTPILFVREDSPYKDRNDTDCYDIHRDATTYTGDSPVIAHPPCRAWGVLSHMANPRPGEKELAFFAIDIIRKNGGILEHPAGSRLFKEHLPDAGMFPDQWGGHTILIDQYDFGHVAHKPTKLYIVGCPVWDLPPLPPVNTDVPKRSICGNVPNTTRCTQYQREYTPPMLIDWMMEVINLIQVGN